MLVGMALENLCKGIIVGRDPRKVDRGELKGVKGHDLEGLIGRCGITVSCPRRWTCR